VSHGGIVTRLLLDAVLQQLEEQLGHAAVGSQLVGGSANNAARSS
jgi:hypothetical protein